MNRLTTRLLLTFDGEELTYADAILCGLLTGTWQRLERTLAAGLALSELAEDQGEATPEGELRAATVVFRRSRRLLAAQDLRAWLQDRGLDASDLAAHVRRSVLIERHARGISAALAARRPAPELLAASLRAEAFFSGALAACSEELVERAAAAHALGREAEAHPALREALLDAALAGPDRGLRALPRAVLEERIRAATAREAALRQFAAEQVTDAAARRRLETRRLEWTRVRYEEIVLATGGAAREAALCVREDAMALAQVAARAHVECTAHERDMAGLEPDLRAGLAAARPGELIGPLGGEGAWRLLHVRDRSAPSAGDAHVLRRVRSELLSDLLARHAAGRVAWHGDV